MNIARRKQLSFLCRLIWGKELSGPGEVRQMWSEDAAGQSAGWVSPSLQAGHFGYNFRLHKTQALRLLSQ